MRRPMRPTTSGRRRCRRCCSCCRFCSSVSCGASCSSSVECTLEEGNDGKDRGHRGQPDENPAQSGEDRAQPEAHHRQSEAHSRQDQEVVRTLPLTKTRKPRSSPTRTLFVCFVLRDVQAYRISTNTTTGRSVDNPTR